MTIDDSSDLFQLTYVSNRSPDLRDDEVVDEIVLPAITKNRRAGITGCLWFDRVHFVQVIEGPRAVVTTLMETIQRDPRHSRIEVIRAEVVSQRSFVRFGMRLIHDGGPSRLVDLIAMRDTRGSINSAAMNVAELVRAAVAELSSWTGPSPDARAVS